MVTMTDLFGPNAEPLVMEQERLGNITLRSHEDDADYMIANYTPKAAYEGDWNPVTLASRGLIFHTVSEQVLARPFAKFFNYGQDGAPSIGYTQEVWASNKYDGSLGIGYIDPSGRPAIATRGSFHSTQAQHATALLRAEPKMLEGFVEYEVSRGRTPLFEIIYPENRIVLDYGDKDYLQYLGDMENATGAFFSNEEEPVTFGELLRREPRPNAEGYVVWLDRKTAVKIKQPDYVALHKIVTNLNEKTVWTQVQNGPIEFRKFVADLPDELQSWAEQVGFDLNVAYAKIIREIDDWYIKATEAEYTRRVAWDAKFDRGRFARVVKDNVPSTYQGFMFYVLDGRDYQGKVWKMIEPKGAGSRPSSALNEEA